MSIVDDFAKAFNRQDVGALRRVLHARAPATATISIGEHRGQAGLRADVRADVPRGPRTTTGSWTPWSRRSGRATAAEWTFGYVVTDAVPRSTGRKIGFRGMSLFELERGKIAALPRVLRRGTGAPAARLRARGDGQGAAPEARGPLGMALDRAEARGAHPAVRRRSRPAAGGARHGAAGGAQVAAGAEGVVGPRGGVVHCADSETNSFARIRFLVAETAADDPGLRPGQVGKTTLRLPPSLAARARARRRRRRAREYHGADPRTARLGVDAKRPSRGVRALQRRGLAHDLLPITSRATPARSRATSPSGRRRSPAEPAPPSAANEQHERGNQDDREDDLTKAPLVHALEQERAGGRARGGRQREARGQAPHLAA